MISIETGKQLINLKGDPLKDGSGEIYTIGTATGAVLSSDQAGGKMKLYILASRFAKDDVVELDEADFSLVKTCIERTQIFTPLISGQLLMLIEAMESAEKGKGKEDKGK